MTIIMESSDKSMHEAPCKFDVGYSIFVYNLIGYDIAKDETWTEEFTQVSMSVSVEPSNQRANLRTSERNIEFPGFLDGKGHVFVFGGFFNRPPCWRSRGWQV